MSTPSLRSAQLAEDQAALWAAKLDGGSLNESDRLALQQWLASSPNHRTLLSQYCQFSTDLEAQLPELVRQGRITAPAARKPARRRVPLAFWSAATLAAAAAIVAGVWFRTPRQETTTVATSVAQRQTLKLADGTVVELNARTSLLVSLGASERHVRMADGEAFFTVAKDKSRPFIVETPGGSVRVTGTVFDVHADSATELAVTVVEGSVQVAPCATPGNPSPAPAALTANDQLVATGHGPASVHTLSTSEVEDALAWRHGEIVFDGTPLATALARFGRYHGRTLTPSPEVAQLRVGGRFSLDNLNAFLNAIEAFLPVQVSQESSGAILVKSRAGG